MTSPVAIALAIAVVCFFIGSINPATILARLLGKDVRSAGSGNPGATNAARILGPRWGIVVAIADVAKGWIPTVVLLDMMGVPAAALGGLATVMGHMFSPFLRFHGGKGVATTLGAMLGLTPWTALGAMVVFAVAKAARLAMGEAAVITAGALVAAGVIRAVVGWGEEPVLLGCWLSVLGVLVIGRHHRNIRLWWDRTSSLRGFPPRHRP